MGEVPEYDPNKPPAPPAWQPPAPPSGPPSYWQQPAPPPYGHGYPPPYPPVFAAPYSGRTNTLAIVSLVSAFFVSVAAIVTGHIALGQIKRTGEQGRGLAIAGLVIGYAGAVGTALLVAFLLVVGLIGGFATTTSSYGGQDGSALPPHVGQVPDNANSFGGIAFGKNGAVVPPAAGNRTVDQFQLPPVPQDEPEQAYGLESIGIQPSAQGQPVQVVIYLDFQCAYCADFEKQVGPGLNNLRDQGKVTVEYRPVAYVDEYSFDAAVAAACVAASSPGKYTAFMDSLFANQPAEDGDGLDESALAKLAAGAGAGNISDCMDAGTYGNYADYVSVLALGHGVTGPSTVFMDGQQWQEGTFAEFSAPILAAKK